MSQDRYLPPNSARIGYVTEGALLIFAIHRRCQRSPSGLSTNKNVEAKQRPSKHVNLMRVRPWKTEKTSVSIETFSVLFVVALATWAVINETLELREIRGGRPGIPSLINLRFLWT